MQISHGKEITFSKGKEMFLENCKALEKSPSTISQYRKSLTRFEEFLNIKYNRPIDIDEVKPEDFEQFLFQVFNPAEYSSSMRHNVTTAFKSMYSYLKRRRLCENIGKLVGSVKVETDERLTVSEMELKRIMQHISSATARAVLYTQYYTGARIGEALNLTLEDVDLENDELHLKDTKNKEDRIVPINERLKKILKEYLQKGRVACGTNKFFSTYPKGQICAQQVNKYLRTAKTEVGITKAITSHSLRHSFATNLVSRNVDVVTLKKLMGHKSIKTTSIYCHTSLEELEEAVNVL